MVSISYATGEELDDVFTYFKLESLRGIMRVSSSSCGLPETSVSIPEFEDELSV